jgi:hypothetical protein
MTRKFNNEHQQWGLVKDATPPTGSQAGEDAIYQLRQEVRRH